MILLRQRLFSAKHKDPESLDDLVEYLGEQPWQKDVNGIRTARVLSKNPKSQYSIKTAKESLKREYGVDNLDPIMNDAGGNYFAIDNKSGAVVFFDHETGKTKKVAKNKEEFWNKIK